MVGMLGSCPERVLAIGLGKLVFVGGVLFGSSSSLKLLDKCYPEGGGICPIGGVRGLQVEPGPAGSGSALELLNECDPEEGGVCPIGGVRGLQVQPGPALKQVKKLLREADYCKTLRNSCKFDTSSHASMYMFMDVDCELTKENVNEIFTCMENIPEAHGVKPWKPDWHLVLRNHDSHQIVQLPSSKLSKLSVSSIQIFPLVNIIGGSIEENTVLAHYLGKITITISPWDNQAILEVFKSMNVWSCTIECDCDDKRDCECKIQVPEGFACTILQQNGQDNGEWYYAPPYY